MARIKTARAWAWYGQCALSAEWPVLRPGVFGPRYPMRFVKALRLCCSGAGLQFLIYATKLEAFVQFSAFPTWEIIIDELHLPVRTFCLLNEGRLRSNVRAPQQLTSETIT